MDPLQQYPPELAIPILTAASGVIVLAVAGFLLVQGVIAVLRPHAVRKFLGGFASSAKAHFAELAARILAGLAFLQFAPYSALPLAFGVFGIVLVLTSVALVFVPWRLHRRFAQWAVPLATRHMGPFAVGCLAGAAAICYGVLLGKMP